MMVVAIIGLMMTLGVPPMLRVMHQGPLRKAVNDVMEICSHARGQAILHGVTTTVVFHPQTRQLALLAVPAGGTAGDSAQPDPTPAAAKPSAASGSPLNSAQFASGITIDMLDINFQEYKDADEARVHFFPDGTSDEMTLVLHSGDQYRKITLEVTTGLASVEDVR